MLLILSILMLTIALVQIQGMHPLLQDRSIVINYPDAGVLLHLIVIVIVIALDNKFEHGIAIGKINHFLQYHVRNRNLGDFWVVHLVL